MSPNDKIPDKSAPVGSGGMKSSDKSAPAGSNGMKSPGKSATSGAGGIKSPGKAAPAGSGGMKSGTGPTATGGKATHLAESKDAKDKTYSKDKKGGSPKEPCTPVEERWLKVKWTEAEVYCGDPANLQGTAKGIKKEVEGTGQAKVKYKEKDERSVATMKARGQTSFELKWPMACGLDFSPPKKGESSPAKLPVEGTLAADGMNAKTPQALAVKRLPDQEPKQVSIPCSSPKSVNGTSNYSWDAKFKLGVKDTDLLVRMTLQVKKAWLGKSISFAAADKLKQPWGYIKKSGAAWKYYDTAKKSWEAVPRDISKYKVTGIVFVKSGTDYVSRDDASKKWPEAFAEPTNFETKKTAWLKNIHQVWDHKLKLQRKDLKGAAPGCCEWPLDVKVSWSDAAGDKTVYIIWAQEYERSNARDWYLTYPSDGVAGHECGHLLAAYDEYAGGAIHPKTRKIDANTIMGQNLTTAKPRHLDDMRKETEKQIKSWIGREWKLEVKAK
jgi:hypothetical protein